MGIQERQAELQTQIAESLLKYMDQADARMKRLEDNLDGLIRVIAAEHGNGRQKKR